MGLIDFFKGLFKSGKASDLLEQAHEKLQEGSLDGILEKVGVDSDKVESIVGGVAGAVGMAEKVFGKDDETAAEEAETTTNEE